VQTGLKLDLVHGRAVGRVGDADEQAIAPLVERQRAACLQCFGLDEFGRQVIGIEGAQIDQRKAECVRRKFGDIRLAELLRRDQFLDEGDAGLVRTDLHLLGIALGEQTLLHHRATQTGQLTLRDDSNHLPWAS
jgi:hypothetical protein